MNTLKVTACSSSSSSSHRSGYRRLAVKGQLHSAASSTWLPAYFVLHTVDDDDDDDDGVEAAVQAAGCAHWLLLL
jgi:hypothetical protein